MEYTIHLSNKSADAQSEFFIFHKAPDMGQGRHGTAWLDSWRSLPPATHFDPHTLTIDYVEILNASSKLLPAGRGSQLPVYEPQQLATGDFEWMPIQQMPLVPSPQFAAPATGNHITYAPLNFGAVSETPAFVVNSFEPER